MSYFIRYDDDTSITFSSMADLYDYLLEKRLSIESMVLLSEKNYNKEVHFCVYDEYGLDVGFFYFLDE